MGRAEFQLAFDGPALRHGTMDVNELASSLLAVGDLFRNANTVLNENRSEVSVRVRSDFKKGSFEVALLLDQGILEHARSLLFPGALVGAGGLVKLLFGTDAGKKGVAGAISSVLDLWKKLGGEKPKQIIKDEAKGITIVVNGSNNQINVEPKTAALYASDEIRSSILGIVRPLAKKGVKDLQIRSGKKVINCVEKADLPADLDERDGVEDDAAANVRRDRREAILRVTRANFEKGKWGFSDGAASFNAEITDKVFKQQLDAREVGFYKGDTLKVILLITQVAGSDGQNLQTTYEIEKVLAHERLPNQQKLLPQS